MNDPDGNDPTANRTAESADRQHRDRSTAAAAMERVPMLQPPPGGLARLRRTIEARAQAAPTNRFVSPRLAVAASLALVAVIGVSLQPRDATHVAPVRAFDRQLRAAMAALPRPGQIVETGVVRELPSGRDDVRIIVAAPPIAIGAPLSP